MSSVRLRRLQADFEKLAAYAQRHPRVRLVQVEGQPPEKYQVEFQLRSIQQKDDQLAYINRHLVEITLPRDYPRMPPQCRMLTPVFHPNIAPHAICIGDHWNAGEPLWSMVMRIGEMLAYQSYNTKSPLNGEAARWVGENEASLPLDPVPLYVEQPDHRPAAAASAPPTSGPVPIAKVVSPKPPSAGGIAAARIVQQPPASAEALVARVVKKPATAAPAHAKPATEIPTARVVSKPPASAVSGPPKPQTNVPTARVVQKPQPAAPSPGTGVIACVCPGCGASYDVPAVMAGKNARCKTCRTIITIPTR